MVYIPGALPCFEGFGGLPTDLVREDGTVQDGSASELLDMLIVPGGSLVESQSLRGSLVKEIKRMVDAGKFILGVCSGFQVLARATDIGRLSSLPIIRQGLGLLDVEFKPLICTDRVQATTVGKSFMTERLGKEVTGFHCHTYGKTIPHKGVKPILVSQVQRVNYHTEPQNFVSGFTNKEGNIVGVLLHGLLDENPIIVRSVLKSLNINHEELRKIKEANSELLKEMKREIGISTHSIAQNKTVQSPKSPVCLMVISNGSGSGKTFIVTGIAGVLKKRGFNVGMIKVGGDIRDIVPSLYLIKEPIKSYSSIKIGNSGWTPISEVIEEASKNYDLLLIESAMGCFTGCFNEKVRRPASTVEVARTLDAPTIMVVGCNKAGIEGATASALNYIKLMKKLGIKIRGVILNKVRVSYMTDEIRQFIKSAFKNCGVELLGIVPRIDLEGRGTIPEIEIKYEEFGRKAVEAIEGFLDLDTLVDIAEVPVKKSVDYGKFLEKFKGLFLTSFNCNIPKGGSREVDD